MESNNTAYSPYILCKDCSFCPIRSSVTADTKFSCKWQHNVQNVGICKYFKKVGGSNGNSKD